MDTLNLNTLIPSSITHRKEFIKNVFKNHENGVLFINKKYQIQLKNDKDLQKLLKIGFLKQVRKTLYKNYAGGWKKTGTSQSFLILNPFYKNK